MANQQLSTNTFGVAKWVVSSDATQGTHITISAATASASSGDTILLRDMSFTEDVAMKTGVNYTALPGAAGEPTTTVTGKWTYASAGTVSISNIKMTTNSDNTLAITGSSASIVNISNCNLNCSTTTGISFTTANTSAAINITNCIGNLGTTGIAFHTMTSTGTISYSRCNFSNSGGSSTVSSNSAGISFYNYSSFASPIGSTSTGGIDGFYSIVDSSAQNAIALTANGSGTSGFIYSTFYGGTNSSVTVGSGATLGFQTSEVASSNTNAITGSGSIIYSLLGFIGTSKLINTTTQANSGTINGRIDGNAPNAGFIGESITASATSVATTSTTPKTIVSITLTPGVWDISGISASTATGGTGVMSAVAGGISTTDNTVTYTSGVDGYQTGAPASTLMSTSVPRVRVTISASTTYYYVVVNVYTSTTCPTNARISATRVG